jgi:hypothetical protein
VSAQLAGKRRAHITCCHVATRRPICSDKSGGDEGDRTDQDDTVPCRRCRRGGGLAPWTYVASVRSDSLVGVGSEGRKASAARHGPCNASVQERHRFLPRQSESCADHGMALPGTCQLLSPESGRRVRSATRTCRDPEKRRHPIRTARVPPRRPSGFSSQPVRYQPFYETPCPYDH